MIEHFWRVLESFGVSPCITLGFPDVSLWNFLLLHFGISEALLWNIWSLALEFPGDKLWNILNLRRDRCQSWSKERLWGRYHCRLEKELCDRSEKQQRSGEKDVIQHPKICQPALRWDYRSGVLFRGPDLWGGRREICILEGLGVRERSGWVLIGVSLSNGKQRPWGSTITLHGRCFYGQYVRGEYDGCHQVKKIYKDECYKRIRLWGYGGHKLKGFVW